MSSLPEVNPLVRASSGDQAALYIRRLIFDGHLTPGTRVPQEAVAKALGISRIPVREALIALEREGWLTIEPHRGAFINALDEQAVRDHYELYGLVYGFAASRAVSRAVAGLVDRLAQLERELVSASSPDEVERVTVAFHSAMVEGAHSPRIKVVLRAMSAIIPGNFFVVVPAAIDLERRGISAIVRAVRKDDSDKAAAEYARMMHRIGDQVVAVLKERGLFEHSSVAPHA